VTASLSLCPTFGPHGVPLRPGRSRSPLLSRWLCKVRRVDDSAELAAERALVERAQAGDREALGAILRKHGPRLYRSVLLPRLGSAASAEEALSRTYVKVLERFDQFSWQAVGVYPWLRVVALRVALDLLRARKRELLFEPEDVERELDAAEREAHEADALERHDLNCAKERVRELLLALHPRYADAIRMRILEERSREEAAQSLGVSVATFDVVLHRSMAALRKAISERGGQA